MSAAVKTMLDRAEGLRRAGGDAALCRELLDVFRGDVPRLMGLLDAALAQQSAPALRCAAHSLKGAACVIGATTIVQQAWAVEQLAAADRIADAGEPLRVLRADLYALARWLETEGAMTKILVVDDTPTDQKLVGWLLEKNPELHAIFASNGKDALTVIAREDPDIVLTDLQMPEMDGLQLVKRIRREHSAIPVILMTAFGSEDIAIEALHQGAANYVAKKNLAHDLLESVESVLALASDQRMQQHLFAHEVRTEADFTLDNDIALIPPLVNYLKENLARMRLLDETGLIRVTVALREALMNAVIHGNLQVSSELRDRDLEAYYQLIETRRRHAPYAERRVHVHSIESNSEARYVIRDEGTGFDPGQVPDPTHPDNMEKAHGRGLLLIRTFMDHFEHNELGNEITMIKRREAKSV